MIESRDASIQNLYLGKSWITESEIVWSLCLCLMILSLAFELRLWNHLMRSARSLPFSLTLSSSIWTFKTNFERTNWTRAFFFPFVSTLIGDRVIESISRFEIWKCQVSADMTSGHKEIGLWNSWGTFRDLQSMWICRLLFGSQQNMRNPWRKKKREKRRESESCWEEKRR